MFILAMLFIGSLFFLARKGKVGPPPWLLDRHSPEAEARRILAQRFAQSEITTEEFMERASVLNWTPGNEAFPPRDGKKKR